MFNEFKLISRAIKRMFGELFQSISKHCRIHLRLGTVGKFMVRACFILLAIAIGIAPFILMLLNSHYIDHGYIPILAIGCAVWGIATFILSCIVGCDYYPEEKEKEQFRQ